MSDFYPKVHLEIHLGDWYNTNNLISFFGREYKNCTLQINSLNVLPYI